MSGLAGAWDPAPLVLGASAASLLLFLHGLVRLRRRGRADHAGWGRLALFVCGLTCMTLSLVSPLDAAGDRSLLSAHMAEHLLLGDAGPALVVLAVRGPLLVFVVPAGLLRACTRVALLRTAVGALFRPAVSLGVWATAFGAWHVPAAYEAALRHPFVHELEHASFVLAGLLVWTQLLDPARRNRLSLARRLAYAGSMFCLGQLLGDLLLLDAHPLYPTYAAASPHLFGWSALEDQQLAGLVMMGEQLMTLGTYFFVLLRSIAAPLPLGLRPS
jgi:putative membrane protein